MAPHYFSMGGMLAGVALGWAVNFVPVILMFAGGAMLTSVVLDVRQRGRWIPLVRKPQFVVGLLAIPLLNLLLR